LLTNVTIYPRAKIVKTKPVKSKVDGVPKTKIVVGDVFGMLCIHTRQYNICSNSFKPLGGPPYP